MRQHERSQQKPEIRIKPFEVFPFSKDFVAKNPSENTYMFLDSEELFLLDQLREPATVASLIERFQKKFGRYSCRKIYQTIIQLMKRTFLDEESQERLSHTSDFAPFISKPKRRRLFLWTHPALIHSVCSPLVRLLGSVAGIVLMGLALCASLLILLFTREELEYLQVKESYFLGVVCWSLSLVLIAWLKNLFRFCLLKSKNLETPGSGLVFRWGVPFYTVDDGDILTLGWTPVLRFHLACLLFPGLLSFLGAVVFLVHPDTISAIWALSGLVTLFLDLSPFVPRELLRMLDRLAGRSQLLENLRAFVDRKYVKRVLLLGSSFENEGYFILFGTFAVLWVYSAYRVVSLAMEWHLSRLQGVLILGRNALEWFAAVAFLIGFLSPAFVLLWHVLRIVALNAAPFVRKVSQRFARAITAAKRGAEIRRDDLLNCIRNVPVLGGLSEDSLSRLANCLETEAYRKNARIVSQGDKGDAFYIIYEGSVAIISESETGLETVLAVLSKDDSFGEMSLVNDNPRTATALALTPVTVLKLSKDVFQSFVMDHIEDKQAIVRLVQLGSFLNNVPLFEEVPAEVLYQVLMKAEQRVFSPGEVIVKEGNAGDEFFVIRSGKVQFWKDYDSTQPIEIRTLTEGSYFGEIALMEAGLRTATAVAQTECKLVVLTREAFFLLLQSSVTSGVLLEVTTRARLRSDMELVR